MARCCEIAVPTPSGGGTWWSEEIQCDPIPEALKALDETASDPVPVMLLEVGAAEIDVRAVVLQEIIDADQNRMGHSH